MLQMKKLEKDIHDFIEDILIDKAADFVDAVKERTPVDTETLKKAWAYGVELVTAGPRQNVPPVYSYTHISKDGDTYSINIINGMFYASFVEFGTPQVHTPGRLMNTKTVEEFRGRLPRVISMRIASFLRMGGTFGG